MTYAHWEGGIKELAECYLHFVEQQGCLRSALRPNFIALSSISSVKEAGRSNNLTPYIGLVNFLIDDTPRKYKLPDIQLIDSESNLNTKVLRNILECVGLPDIWSIFDPKQRIIDTALLKVRNEIAHTGRSDREEIGLSDLLESVLELLESFKNELENAAVLKKYLL